MRHKIMLLGKTGQLGWELQRMLAPVGKIYEYGSKDLDLKNIKSLVQLIRDIKPQFIINAAAYTLVDRAESEPELAMTINGVVPGIIAEKASLLNAIFIHYSTDYVFDGNKGSAYTEEDIPNPLNIYGQSKLLGEKSICQVGGTNIILRTSWMYSLRRNDFVARVLAWSRSQEILRIVTDQIGSPTWAKMLAEITSTMISRSGLEPQDYFFDKRGIYHVSGKGGVSRYEFAKTILRFDPRAIEQRFHRLEPTYTFDFPTPSKRPLNTTLTCSRFEQVFGYNLPNWEESLFLALETIDFAK